MPKIRNVINSMLYKQAFHLGKLETMYSICHCKLFKHL